LPENDHSGGVVEEFTRAAPGFAERTKGRFENLDAVAFSQVSQGVVVAEVGAGTGHFLSLFEDVASALVAVDLTPAMLQQARRDHPGIATVVGDGARLPLRSSSVNLAACAQMLHHVWEPLPILNEMRRVVAPGGSVLIVDQVAPERYEEAVAMTELEIIRDPSHAASRPPSAFRVLVQAAGLEVADERVVESQSRFSNWMWPGEFPEARIEQVRAFIETRGKETGMNFEPDGDDFLFTRRRIMLRATKPVLLPP
jgi:ubiquinone/menaquinone biosynthesis C-methylase UbiE